MRTFRVHKLPSAPGRVILAVADVDNGGVKAFDKPSMQLAKLHAEVAIRQRLTREVRPMPECDECQGGLLEVAGQIVDCGNPECRDWLQLGLNIGDHVEVCIQCDEEVGVIEL